MNRSLFIILVLLLGNDLSAQNAPVTTAATVSTAIPGQTVYVPVTVSVFSNIASVNLYIDYDYSSVHYLSCTKNPALGGSFSAGDMDLGNNVHRIIIGWYNMTPVTLAPGSWIFQYSFSYIGGSSALTWFDNGPACKYTDGEGNTLNDIPTSTYYINGRICGMMPAPGTISGPAAVCQGDQNVLYSIDTIPGVTGYQWVVPNGAAIVSGNNSPEILVSFSDSASSGNVSVFPVNECGNGLLASLPVNAGAMPHANAGADTSVLYGTCATFHASGCSGNGCSYHWEPAGSFLDPDVQDPQTFSLYNTTIFTVTVTAPGAPCFDSDEVIAEVYGGPLTANPQVLPGIICETDSARLFANPGGGSGFYTYSWTCSPPGTPPWSSSEANPGISPVVTTTYNLVVSDGINHAYGTVDLTVTPKPPVPFIHMENNLLVSDACCGNQWYLDNVAIPGANGPDYLPENNGSYFVIVTLDGCMSDSSNLYQVVITQTTHPMASKLQIIPNPAKDFFILRCSGINLKKINIAFFSSDGVLVKELVTTLADDPDVHLIDVRDLPAGMYFINIKTDDQNLIQKLVII
ncbi:MAG: T9SS type A sorting domain-containing protein [Syntrophothermus sp.]